MFGIKKLTSKIDELIQLARINNVKVQGIIESQADIYNNLNTPKEEKAKKPGRPRKQNKK